ncbi:uncharacterized protein mRpL50 isoform X1 [Procambarus clarkii]|uniref:uncharacterized protein mRpL50 isoform X1 n=1 Tax=Procambarus clarkii TaxID=6728 RepID=UPI003742FCA7
MAASITNIRLLRSAQLPGTGGHNVRLMAIERCGHQHRFSSSAPDQSNDDETLAPDRKFSFDAASLAARGYLRSQKPYYPVNGVHKQVLGICSQLIKSSNPDTPFKDASTKFQVLAQCSKTLKHAVPNSLMHKITNIRELVTFYETPVNTSVPLDMMKDMDLPKNLHVIYKYNRFHPETDTKFGGVSAFTKDSTLIVGFKNKKRYPGHVARTTWPFQ